MLVNWRALLVTPLWSPVYVQRMVMKRYSIHLALVLLGTAVLAVSAGDLDWPQYLGPRRNSTSDQKGILRTWPTNGPAVLWTVPVGKGFGGPVVKDGKVYLLDREDKVGDRLRCLDLHELEAETRIGRPWLLPVASSFCEIKPN